MLNLCCCFRKLFYMLSTTCLLHPISKMIDFGLKAISAKPQSKALGL